MREWFMEWITNLTLFSLISSVCIKLLPGKSYAPYVRLFSGIVLILLFLNPVLALFKMDGDIPEKMDVHLSEIEEIFEESALFEVEN